MSKQFYAAMLVLSLALPGSAPAASLYSDLGGHEGLVRIVDSARAIWLKDPRISHTFDNSNLVRLDRLLVSKLCQLTGGGCIYRGQDMQRVHQGLHITIAQFNALAEDMQTAMDQLNVPFSTQSRLIALLAPMHREVVAR